MVGRIRKLKIGIVNRALLAACFSVLSLAAFAQTWQLEGTIAEPFDYFYTDNLGFVYAIKGSEIRKYSATGKRMFEYSEKRLGKISHVDVSFSLRPILFYLDVNILAVLDNTLSATAGTHRLNDHGLELAQLACSSFNNYFWFYDLQNFELIRTDENLNHFKSSGNLGQLLGISIEPNYLLEHNNFVYLNNPSTGILVFDIFGTYYKTIPLLHLDRFQVWDNDVFFTRDQKLYRYNHLNFTETEIELPENAEKGARVEKNTLVIGTQKGINIYKLRRN
jgi:hypothetical protein